MNAQELVNRYSILYGDEFPLLKELERAVNTHEISSIFKLVSEFSSSPQKQDLLNDLRNIISSNPDIFVLFRIIESIDDNDNLSLVRTNVALKNKIHETVNLITGEKYSLPNGIRRLTTKFEGDALTDALSQGQIESKLWLVETVKELDIDLGEMVYVCAGWYGVLSALMFERIGDKFGKILSFDVDPTTENPADMLNKEYVSDGVRFKAAIKDIHDLRYENDFHEVTYYRYHDSQNYEIDIDFIEVDKVSCVINTSCEHIDRFDEWWSNIPDGTLVIMQNNNFVEHDDVTVVNTVKSEQRWVDKLNVSELLFRGTLSLPKYNRYMVIGRK